MVEKEKLKKTLQLNAELAKKGMVILVEKAACFESNNYNTVSTKELDVLLQWCGVDKKGTKKAEKVAKWKEISLSGIAPPVVHEWTDEDEDQLTKIKKREIDISETYLGRYAALQKRNAVAAILDFTDKEWEALKTMREADAVERSKVAVLNSIDNNTGALGMENDMIDGESGAL